MKSSYETIAGRIDHALLSPTMTEAELLQGCRLADVFEVASVCVKPYAVGLATSALSGSMVKVGTVVGFPHGGQSIATKVFETSDAIGSGASEIDMVVNVGAVLAGKWTYVEDEIHQVTREVRKHQAILKVIFETCYLSDEHKIQLCKICSKNQVDYIKTSTGYGTEGATAADLILMRKHIPLSIKLKASGGIKDLKTVLEFTELGADRLGLSRTNEILTELRYSLGLPTRDVSRGTLKTKHNREDSY